MLLGTFLLLLRTFLLLLGILKFSFAGRAPQNMRYRVPVFDRYTGSDTQGRAPQNMTSPVPYNATTWCADIASALGWLPLRLLASALLASACLCFTCALGLYRDALVPSTLVMVGACALGSLRRPWPAHLCAAIACLVLLEGIPRR